MIDVPRRVAARFVVHELHGPRPLVIRAWLWLAAEAEDVESKRCCLNAILELDPENEPASLALLVLDQARPTS